MCEIEINKLELLDENEVEQNRTEQNSCLEVSW